MTTTIDKKVVELGFDNKQFESNAQTSLKTIGALNKNLNLDGVIKGLGNLSVASKSLTLGNISDNVQNISSKFSALGVIGFTVLQTLTTAAMGLAIQLVKTAAGVDSINAGFKEYEDSISAVQTILANTADAGTTLEDVNRVMATLNEYANKTKFSFGDMTKAVGIFTANGVGLEDSVVAIKGLFNAVAMTGGDAVKANLAVQQLSQGIANGKLMAMDWMSVISAGIAAPYQKEIESVARAHGVNVDEMIKKNGSFRDSLKEGWVTKDIALEAFSHLTGDLTEEELKASKTVSVVQAQYALLTKEQVKSLDLTDQQLKSLKLNSETAAAIGANYTSTQLKNLGLTAEQIKLVEKYYGDASKSMETAAATAAGYSDEEIARILKTGQLANESATKLKTYSQVMETISSNIVTSWAQSFKLVIGDINEASELWTTIGNTIGGVLQESGDARNKMLQDWKDAGGREALVKSLNNTLEGLLNILNPIKQAFEEVFPPIAGVQLANLTKGLEALTSKLKFSSETADLIKRSFKGIAAIFTIIFQAVWSVVGAFFKLGKTIQSPFDGILRFTAGIGDFLVGLNSTIKTDKIFDKAISNIARNIRQTIPMVQKFLTDLQLSLGPVGESLRTFISGIVPFFQGLGKSISETFNANAAQGAKTFSDTLTAVLTPLKSLLDGIKNTFIDFGKKLQELSPIFAKVGEFLSNAFSGLGPEIQKGIQNIDVKKISTIFEAGLLGVLVLAVKKFLGSGSKAIGGLTQGVTGVLDGVRGSLEAWQKSIKAKSLLQIAAAVGILALSLIALSMVDADKLGTAVATMSIIFGELVLSMKAFDNIKSDQINKSAIGLIALTLSFMLMATAVAKIASIDQDAISRGLVGLGVMLGELAVFMKVADLGKLGTTKSIGLMAFALALDLLAGALSNFGRMKPEELAQGLTALAVTLGSIAVFIKLTEEANPIKLAISLVIIGGAMMVMALALKALGNLNTQEMFQGFIAMGAALTIFGVAANKIKPNQIVKMAVSFGVIGASLLIMAAALKALGSIDPKQLVQGFEAMGVSLAMMVVALNAMRGTLGGAAAILVTAVALGMLVPILFALGNMPLSVIAIGLGAIAGIFVVLGLAGLILGPLVPVIFALGVAMTLIGAAGYLVGAGLLAFSAGLASLAISGAAGAAAIVLIVTQLLSLIPIFIAAIVNGIVQFATMIAANAPTLVNAITTTFMAVVNGLVSTIPEFVGAILKLINSLLQTLNENAPGIVNAGIELLIILLTGIRDHIKQVTQVAVEIILEFIAGINSKMGDIVQSAFDTVISFIDGLTKGIKDNMPRLLTSIGELAKSIIEGLAKGLTDGLNSILTAIGDLANKALAEFKRILGIQSPSKEFLSVGKYASMGFAKGLNKYSYLAGDATENLGDKAIQGLNDSIAYIASVVNSDLDMSPTVRPVVDLSNVTAGGKQISQLLGQSLTIPVTAGRLSNMMAATTGSSATTQLNPAGQTIVFQQTNNSPKALSALEIYRQTRNQLSLLKGLANA